MLKAQETLTTKQLIAFFGMVVGMFMAILDIQIVASSLPIIGAGLSASIDELSWVQTAYLIAEVIIIPVSGYITRVLSTRITFGIAASGFTAASILCAFAWDIQSMIVFRAIQGLFGGMIIPTTFTTAFMIFPRKNIGQVSMCIGLAVTIAPTLGPIIGGYITNILSWEFMFLMNVLPGIFVTITSFVYINFDRPNYTLLKYFDYIGVILIIMTLGSLQYILEEGSPRGWFESNIIITLTIISSCSFIYFLYHELHASHPILDLRAFKNRNFTLGCVFAFLLGIGLFGTVLLQPMFLGNVADMNSLQIGLVMSIMGLCQLIAAPAAGIMFDRGANRKMMLAFGLFMFGTGTYLNSYLTPDSTFWGFFWPQIFRGSGLMFCFIPINDLALGYLPSKDLYNASSLYNLMRNLGGAVGLAIISRLLSDNSKLYKAMLNEHIMYNDSLLSNMQGIVVGKIGYIDIAKQNFAGFVDYMLFKNAFTIVINEVFVYISIGFISAILLIPLLKNTTRK